MAAESPRLTDGFMGPHACERGVLMRLLSVMSVSSLLCACGYEGDLGREQMAPLEVLADPPGHKFLDSTRVALSASRPAAIFYNFDGETPLGPKAIRYDGPVALTRSTLLSYIAIAEDDGTYTDPHAELYVSGVAKIKPPKIIPRVLRADRDNVFLTGRTQDVGPLTAVIEIRSLGVEPVRLHAIYLTPNPKGQAFFQDGSFAIETQTHEDYLFPGQRLDLLVSYRPTSTLRSALLVVESDEQSADGRTEVELWGRIF